MKWLTVGAFQMGSLRYYNAVVESQPVTSLKEADDKVLAVHVASTELLTTPLAHRFTREDDDWKREIAPDIFEDDPTAKGEIAKDIGHKEDDVLERMMQTTW